MIKKTDRSLVRAKRHVRIRAKVSGTAERPRMAVFRSSKHIYVQVIDDVAGKTLVAASSQEPEMRGALKTGATIEAAAAVGKRIAEKAKQAGIANVVYDRGGFLYHGRIKALADAAREAGLDF